MSNSKLSSLAIRTWYSQVLAVFRLLVLRVLEYRNTERFSIRTINTLGVCILRPSAHRFDTFIPIMLQNTSTDGSTRGSSSKLRSGGGQLEGFRVLAVFTDPILLILYSKYFGCFLLLVLGDLYCSLSRYSQYSGLRYCCSCPQYEKY